MKLAFLLISLTLNCSSLPPPVLQDQMLMTAEHLNCSVISSSFHWTALLGTWHLTKTNDNPVFEIRETSVIYSSEDRSSDTLLAALNLVLSFTTSVGFHRHQTNLCKIEKNSLKMISPDENPPAPSGAETPSSQPDTNPSEQPNTGEKK